MPLTAAALLTWSSLAPASGKASLSRESWEFPHWSFPDGILVGKFWTFFFEAFTLEKTWGDWENSCHHWSRMFLWWFWTEHYWNTKTLSFLAVQYRIETSQLSGLVIFLSRYWWSSVVVVYCWSHGGWVSKVSVIVLLGWSCLSWFDLR